LVVRLLEMRIVAVGSLLSVSLWAYYEFVVGLLGPSILLHVICVPLILGLLCYWLLPKSESRWIGLIILPFVVPVFTLAMLEGDPAKSTLQWILLGPIAGSMGVGELIAWGVNMLRDQSKANRDAQA